MRANNQATLRFRPPTERPPPLGVFFKSRCTRQVWAEKRRCTRSTLNIAGSKSAVRGLLQHALSCESLAVIKYQQGLINLTALLKQLEPRIRRITSSLAWEYASKERDADATYWYEEIAQDLRLKLITTLFRDYDGVSDINSLMYTCAQNLVRDLRSQHRSHQGITDQDPTLFNLDCPKNQNHQNHHAPFEPDGFDRYESTLSPTVEELDAQIDRANALSRIEHLLPTHTQAHAMYTPTNLPPIAALGPLIDPNNLVFAYKIETKERRSDQPPERRQESAPLGKASSPEGIELKKICDQLDFTKEDFAFRLDIPLPTLGSYIYGRIKKVPSEVMAKARELLKDGNNDMTYLVSRFGTTDLKVIVAQWSKQIGIDANNNPQDRVSLGKVLKISPTTIKRWLDGDCTPTVQKIYEYNERFEQYMSHTAATSAASLKNK